MDINLFERLIYDSESSFLEFKSEQYRFIYGSKEEKGELIKDILAFSNAWRQETAYILIGIKDGGDIPKKVIGITDDIDDAQIQQLVNSNTNKPIDFRYYTFLYNDLKIGVIEIPVQIRPYYLNKDYGKIIKGNVYLRRGSSTDIATPEEIIRMGNDSIALNKIPHIVCKLGNQDLDTVYENLISFKTETPASLPTPTQLESFDPNPIQEIFKSIHLNDYYSKVIEHTSFSMESRHFSYKLFNKGTSSLTNILIKTVIENSEDYYILDSNSKPKRLSRFSGISEYYLEPDSTYGYSNIEKKFGHTEIITNFDRLLPGQSIWSMNRFYIGAKKDLTINANTYIYADQLQAPIHSKLEICFKVLLIPLSKIDWIETLLRTN
ncbi:ATP-binding protein [Leptospira barantonii]|uniref:ATP-binding protein n=1 Tax=Leptospira barantonii TaxID=2023184 RepID=A0A5F2BK75_9LEPT|nr:ATP-binding protein [Leptospira barantonii]TGM05955.1 ATP-binding protein [Leptospira barantonii]